MVSYRPLEKHIQPQLLALQQGLSELVRELEQASARLTELIRDEAELFTWVWHPGVEPRGRREVIEAVTALDYLDGQAATDSLMCPALIGASAETLAGVDEVNTYRLALKAQLLRFKAVAVEVEDETSGAWVKTPFLRLALKQLGHSMLNQRQATRTFHAFHFLPASISYTWAANMKKVSVTSVEDVYARLNRELKTANPSRETALMAMLNSMTQLDPKEPLAKVVEQRPQARANLKWVEQGRVQRKLVYANAPIFILAKPGQTPLYKGLSSLNDIPARLPRSDTRLEPEPLLKALNIYQYQPGQQPKRHGVAQR